MYFNWHHVSPPPYIRPCQSIGSLKQPVKKGRVRTISVPGRGPKKSNLENPDMGR